VVQDPASNGRLGDEGDETDSGGVHEETTAPGIPCVTMRDNTERPITITAGTNILAGTDQEKTARVVVDVLQNGAPRRPPVPLWDGRAALRVVDEIEARWGRT
jgi:UDP-N-acetylglucosamine 2-epimerase (non-hydrolysing)